MLQFIILTWMCLKWSPKLHLYQVFKELKQRNGLCLAIISLFYIDSLSILVWLKQNNILCVVST